MDLDGISDLGSVTLNRQQANAAYEARDSAQAQMVRWPQAPDLDLRGVGFRV